MIKKIVFLIPILLYTISSLGQTVNVQNVSVTGRFNSCSGSNTPTVTLSLVGGSGINIQNGNLACVDPCGTTTLRVNIAGVRWNQSPGAEWLHGLFFPVNAGYTLSGINLPPGFITNNTGCTGQCPAGTVAGPGFYFDGTGANACCGAVAPNDNMPCNNYGDVSLNCSTPFSFFFDLTFCNSQLTGTSETFTLTGTSDGATGCWSNNNAIQGSISFTVNTVPCQPVISTPFTFGPVQRSCVAAAPNYTVDVMGGCGNGTTVSWWTDSIGGTQLGTGSPFTYDPAGSACPVGDTIYASCCTMGSVACITRTPVVITGVCDSMQMGSVHMPSFTCNGLGQIDSISVVNPNGPVSFNLMPGNLTDSNGTFSNLAAGSYTITATDGGGCEISTVVTISPLPILQIANISSATASCVPGNDGSITVTASGGTASYQYNIGGANQSTTSFTNLGSGVYTVTAIDANGCTATTSVNIAPPNAPTISNLAVTPISCNGAPGSIQLTASGGTAPLSYGLMPGAVTNTSGVFNNLTAGSYTVTVTDGANCTVSTSASVIQPPQLSWSFINVIDVLCNGAANGSALLTATGGAGSLTYSLNPGNIVNATGLYSPLGPNTYTVVATDANNCSITTTINVSQPPILQWNSPQIISPTCNSASNGSLTITATGGTNPISYNLQPGNMSSSNGTFTGLSQGSYTVVATDAKNCTSSTVVNITAPTVVQITNVNITAPTCIPGNDGIINVTASGGTPAYLYNIGGPNQSSGLFTNLTNTTYVVTATDANGCTATSIVTLMPQNSPSISNANLTSVSCNGLSDGAMQVIVAGGTPAFSYNLMPGNTTNGTGFFSNLASNTYTVTVTDAAGCTATANIAVSQPAVLGFGNNVINDVSCNGNSDGNIQMVPSGGTGPFTFVLNPGSISNTTGMFTGLAPNTYSIAVTDANGCTASTTVSIVQPPPLSWSTVNVIDVLCNGAGNGSALLNATGGSGTLAYTLSPGNITNTTGLYSPLGPNTYTVIATDANSCTLTSTITVSEPSVLQLDNISTVTPSCVPGNDGGLTITASGGTPTYQYNIGGGNQSSNTFTSLASANYTVTVIDANNCSVTTLVSMTPANAPMITNVISNDVSCHGGNTGSIQVTSSGGSAPLNYNLMPGNVNNATGTFNGLDSNTYIITVTDANSCSVSSTTIISQPSALSWGSPVINDASCNGGADGAVQLTASGGTGSISYVLNPGNISNSTGNFTNLAANTYTIVATDSNNCSISTTLVVGEPPALQWTGTQVLHVACNSGNTGGVTITATGGTSPLTYNVMPGNFNSSNGTFTGLTQGNYTVTVSDSNNCTLSTTISVSQPTALQITNVAIGSPSCTPGNDGTITISASGGTPGYLYNIGSTNQVSNVFNNVGVGIYAVTVTDSNGCKASTLVTVAAPNAPTITSVADTSVSCNGGANGSMQINVSGGAAPLSYTLTPGNVTNSTGYFNNLSAISYTVVVTDALSCTFGSTITITEPTPLVWDSTSQTDLSCNAGNDGSLQVSASGGTGAIVYAINPGSTTNSSGLFTNLTQGTYTITATDANNCTLSTTITINQPPLLQWSPTSITPVSCNGGSDGVISITASGGTPSLSYNLMPGNITNTTGTFTGLSQGVYTIIVTDANNCTLSTTLTMTEPSALQVTNITTTVPSCVPGNDGSITITAIGGTPTYQYNIGGGNQASNIFNNIGSGIYTVTVTDANNCTVSTTVNITAPNAPNISNVQSTNVSCNGGNNGNLQVTAIGGTNPLNYNLMPSNITNTTGSFTTLAAHNYTITVTDAIGCSVSTLINISEPTQVVWGNVSQVDVSCNGGNDGSLQVAASGGTGTITYVINPGATSNTTGSYTNLIQGSYVITATDANNCSISTTINISEPTPIQWSALSTNMVSCNGGSDASLGITANGGTPIYSYNLMPGNLTNGTGTFTGLSQGVYTVVVTDANNCTLSTTITITEPAALQVTNVSTTVPTCVPGNDGSITITASGGTPTYQYNIGGGNQSSNVFNNVGSGNYIVTVTDANNCTVTTSVNIVPPNTPMINSVLTTQASCSPGNDGSITVSATNGQTPYQYNIGIGNQVSNVFNGVGIGTYSITVTDAVGCTATSTTTVQNPPSPTIDSIVTTTASCNPGCDGTAIINVSGGTNPVYTYSINNAPFQSNSVYANLCSNNYVAVAQDGNGCTDTANFIISTANAPSISSVVVDSVNCNGGNDGSIIVTATGGANPLSYVLTPGNVVNGSGTFLNLTQGSYGVSITDANGCSVSTSLIVSEPLSVQFDSVSGSGSSCNGASNGSIFVSNVGGTGQFTYTINPNATFTPPGTFSNLQGNTNYTIIATDANACSVSTSVFISSPATLVITGATSTAVTCNGANNGTIQINATGGTQPYAYNMMPGNVTNANGNFNGVSGGVYSVTVTDANNCSATTSVSVYEPPAIQVNNLTIQDVTCFGTGDGSIQINGTGGIAPLSYTLQPTNQTNSTGSFTNLGPNNYSVVITDANNCTFLTNTPINEPDLLRLDSFSTLNVTCSGLDNGEITVHTSGGNGANSYLLQPLNITNNTGYFNTGISAQQYVVTVTDSNGCAATDSVVITEPFELRANFTKTDVLCNGASTGAINVTPVGGTPSFTYTLTPGNVVNNTGSFSSLPAGVYNVSVVDVNTCSTILMGITITEPTAIQITSLSKEDITCFGDSSGKIQLGAQGGVGTLQYGLSPIGGVQTSPGLFESLYAGTYTVVVTDANSCTLTTSVIINQNPEIVFDSLIVVTPLCHGDANGSIKFDVSGGVGNLLYSVNNSPFTTKNRYTNLTAGNYLISIMDSLSCRRDSNLILIEPDPIEFSSVDLRYISCDKADDGIAMINTTGGVGYHTYYLRPGIAFNRTGIFSELSQGFYRVKVVDTNQCALDTSFTMQNNPNQMVTQIIKRDLPCTGIGNEGEAEVVVSGGEPPYTFEWSTNPVQTTSRIYDLRFGYYRVKIVDASGCEITDTAYVKPGDCCSEVFLPNSFSPNKDGKNDRFRVLSTSGIELKQFEIFNRWGQRVWQTNTYYDEWDGTFRGEDAAIGTYYYIYRYNCTTDGKEYTKKGDITIIR